MFGEQLAHVDTSAADSVIACPGTQHLARTAAEVEHTGPRFQTQRRAESGELFWCEWIMDAMSTFGNVEYPWNVHCRNSFVCMALRLGSAGMGRGAKGFGDEFANCRDVVRVFIAYQHVNLPWSELFRGLPDSGVFNVKKA